MFLDVAHVVRHYVGASASIIGIFMLPSVFETDIRSDLQRRRIRANTYAALKELNHFHTHQNFRAHYPGEQVPIPTTQHRAFNQIFLIDRTNTSGRALSSKHAAEQMAAHMIHLTAFSHLNTRILGLDVNITEERTATVQGVMQTYLSYSSFGVSALVMPREALWRYFQHMTVSWALAFLIPEQSGQTDDQLLWVAYLSLRDDLKREFQKHYDDETRLRRLREDIFHSGGSWWSFARLVAQTVERLFKEHGQAGALYVIRRLALEASEATREDLAHMAQRPFGEPRQARVVRWWERPFRASEEIRLSVQSSLEQRRFQVRADVWHELLNALRRMARSWDEQIALLAQEARQAQDDALREAERAARQIHPLRRNGDRETSTYYDLETGAIGEGHLEHYLDNVLALLDAPISEQDTRTRWEALLHTLYERLLAVEGDSLVASRYAHRAGLRQAVEEELTTAPDLLALREQVRQSFDLRNVVYVQHSNGTPPPNERIAQVLHRLAPHAVVDGDTYHYSEADQESIRLVSTPADAGEEAGEVGRIFRQRLRGFSEYEWVKTGNGDRLDACYIVHGLPLGQLGSTADMYHEYHGNAFLKRMLHVQPEWEQLDEIYQPPEQQP
jgi:hypothetical protein